MLCSSPGSSASQNCLGGVTPKAPCSIQRNNVLTARAVPGQGGLPWTRADSPSLDVCEPALHQARPRGCLCGWISSLWLLSPGTTHSVDGSNARPLLNFQRSESWGRPRRGQSGLLPGPVVGNLPPGPPSFRRPPALLGLLPLPRRPQGSAPASASSPAGLFPPGLRPAPAPCV